MLAGVLAFDIAFLTILQSDRIAIPLERAQSDCLMLRITLGVAGLLGALGLFAVGARVLRYAIVQDRSSELLWALIALVSIVAIPAYYWLKVDPEIRQRVREQEGKLP